MEGLFYYTDVINFSEETSILENLFSIFIYMTSSFLIMYVLSLYEKFRVIGEERKAKNTLLVLFLVIICYITVFPIFWSSFFLLVIGAFYFFLFREKLLIEPQYEELTVNILNHISSKKRKRLTTTLDHNSKTLIMYKYLDGKYLIVIVSEINTGKVLYIGNDVNIAISIFNKHHNPRVKISY